MVCIESRDRIRSITLFYCKMFILEALALYLRTRRQTYKHTSALKRSSEPQINGWFVRCVHVDKVVILSKEMRDCKPKRDNSCICIILLKYNFCLNQFANSWDITFCFDIHFQGQLIWCFCCHLQLHRFGESLTKIGAKKCNSRTLIIFVNGGLYLHFQRQLIWHLCCRPHFHLLYETGRNRSYNSWDTAMFADGDLDLHFQGQMIRYLYCRPRCHILL